MTTKQQCPVCDSQLEVRDVAPCWDCGALPEELDEFKRGEHEYSEWEVFPGLTAVLCDFCDADFGSYDPTYFGLPKGSEIGMDEMRPLRKLEGLSITEDGYCPKCRQRLAFLNLISKAREQNKANE
jgi:hypothetical protein